MIDVAQYRMRIGAFLFNGKGLQRMNHRVLSNKVSSFVTLVVVSALLFSLQAMDPSIEWNPGPRNSASSIKHPSSSLIEKHFNDLIKIDADIVEISSHRFFLTACKTLGIVPRGLQSNVHLSSRKAIVKSKRAFQKFEQKTFRRHC